MKEKFPMLHDRIQGIFKFQLVWMSGKQILGSSSRQVVKLSLLLNFSALNARHSR